MTNEEPPHGRLFSLREDGQSSEVFADVGSIHQQVPNGIRDNARENRKGEAYKNILQSDHLLSGGSQKKYSIFFLYVLYFLQGHFAKLSGGRSTVGQTKKPPAREAFLLQFLFCGNFSGR